MPNAATLLERSRLAARPHYEQSHRFYHTWAHIEEMLAVAGQEAQPLDVAQSLAIIWHDAVYVPGLDKGANERASALLMRDHMFREGWLDDPDGRTAADRAESIILSTIDHTPRCGEAELVLDLDLYRLAVDFDAFQRHADAVKQEYAPIIAGREAAWQSGRTAVYESFLARERIFHCAAMQRFEERARANLRRGIAALETLSE